jgi:hypothetical protein
MQNLRSLVSKLNDATREAMQGAATLCLSRTNYNIEIEHFLLKLLDSSTGDLACILNHFEVNRLRLTHELMQSMDKLKIGNERTPAFSFTLVKLLTEAWTLGSLEFGSEQIRSGHTILALISSEELLRPMHEISQELQKVNADALRKDFSKIVASSNEMAGSLAASKPSSGGADQAAFPIKRSAVRSPKMQAAASTPNAAGTTISEVLVSDLTLAPGTSQQVFSRSDFSGVDKLNIGFYGTIDQDFSNTNCLIWWAIPGASDYVAADSVRGDQFSFLNSGVVQITPYGNQLAIEFHNNGGQPVNYAQVTLYAVAR